MARCSATGDVRVSSESTAFELAVTPAQSCTRLGARSEEHTSEPSHSQISYAVFCLKKKKKKLFLPPLRPHQYLRPANTPHPSFVLRAPLPLESPHKAFLQFVPYHFLLLQLDDCPSVE